MRKSFSLNRISVSVLTLVLLLSAASLFGKDDGKIPITTSSSEAKSEFLKGRELFEKLKFTDANQYFVKAHELDNNFALAYYFDAITNSSAKGFFAQLQKADELKDKASEGEKLIIMAGKAGASGETKKQQESLKKLVSLYPNDERALNFLGQFYFGQQKFNACIDNLKKASQIAPDYSAPYNMLGYSYRSIDNFSAAEKAFKKYIELIPDDPNPYDSYAELLLKEGKYEESITQYQKALKIDPHFVASYLGLACDYNYLGKNEKAKETLDKLYNEAARNDGEKRGASFAKTVVYVDEGNMTKALKEMEKQYALGEKINDASAMSADLNAMGNIYFEMGKYDEAAKKYNESLDKILNSNLSDNVKNNSKRFSLYNDARIALMKDDIKTAKSKSKELLKKAGDDKNNFQMWLAHELMGMIAMNEKNYKKAVDEFNKSNMQNPYTYYRLAMAYQADGNKKDAKKYFKQAANFNALTNLNQAFIRTKAQKMISEM